MNTKSNFVYITPNLQKKKKQILKCFLCHRPMRRDGEIARCSRCNYGINWEWYEKHGWEHYHNGK